jgi:UDP-3-O-[3-hydroxymyristoyl] glucosamine N-acyltransferase
MIIKFSLAELAELTQARLVGNPDYSITGIDALDTACPTDASFLANARYKEQMKNSLAGVICVSEEYPELPQKKLSPVREPFSNFSNDC